MAAPEPLGALPLAGDALRALRGPVVRVCTPACLSRTRAASTCAAEDAEAVEAVSKGGAAMRAARVQAAAQCRKRLGRAQRFRVAGHGGARRQDQEAKGRGVAGRGGQDRGLRPGQWLRWGCRRRHAKRRAARGKWARARRFRGGALGGARAPRLCNEAKGRGMEGRAGGRDRGLTSEQWLRWGCGVTRFEGRGARGEGARARRFRGGALGGARAPRVCSEAKGRGGGAGGGVKIGAEAGAMAQAGLQARACRRAGCTGQRGARAAVSGVAAARYTRQRARARVRVRTAHLFEEHFSDLLRSDTPRRRRGDSVSRQGMHPTAAGRATWAP